MQSTGFALKKKIFPRPLQCDHPLDVNALSRREFPAILRNAVKRQGCFFKRILRLSFFYDEIGLHWDEKHYRKHVAQRCIEGGSRCSPDAHARANQC